jgi:hypothetical protein
MNSFLPASHGFRLILRRPAIPFAEIAWRWSFVATAWVLGAMFLFEYMDSLPVTTADRLLLATRQPILISRAIHRIFHGSAFRFTEAGVLLAIGLTIAWIALASFGRAATVAAVLEEFGIAAAPGPPAILRSLVALNFLRAAVTLAALAGVVGAMLIGSSFWASTHISAADASRLFVLVSFFVSLAWVVLNWLLSVSAIFVVIDRSRTLGSIAATVRLCQQNPGPVLSTGALFGLVHIGAFIAASSVGFTLLGALGSVPAGLVWFAQAVLIFAYCAVADFLYTARLAAYVFIIRGEELAALSDIARVPPLPCAGIRSSIDSDELILSDVPLPAS